MERPKLARAVEAAFFAGAAAAVPLLLAAMADDHVTKGEAQHVGMVFGAAVVSASLGLWGYLRQPVQVPSSPALPEPLGF